LAKTFWCSNKISIVALELFDSLIGNKKSYGDFYEINMENYKRGLDFILDAFKSNKNFTNVVTEIEVVTGITNNQKERFGSQLKREQEKIDKLFSKYRNDFNISLKFVKWNKKQHPHGRRIYSDFGAFRTELPPFELSQSFKDKKTAKIITSSRNNGFGWIEPEDYPKWQDIGYQINY